MSSTARIPLRFLFLGALVAMAGCDTLFGPGDPATIEITPGGHTFDFVGDTLRLEAVVRDDDDEVIADAAIDWSSRGPSVVRIDETGLLTALANGRAWIVAESGGAADSARFIVESPIPCAPLGDLLVPDTVDDSLSQADCALDDWYHDAWRIELSTAREFTIDVTSDQFDSFLLLLDATGQLVGWDDDSGGNLNSRLYIDLDSGTYYPLVTSYWSEETGAYRLTTMEGAHPTPCPPEDSITFPDTVAGATTTGSCNYNGFYIDAWRLELAEATVITLQVVGDGFGMYAAVTDTLGRFLVSGGEGPSSGSWLEVELPAGSYDLWVGGREPDVTGSYTLSVVPGPATRYCPTEGAVAIGTSVTGQLAEDDCFIWFSPADGWELTVTDTVDLELAVTGDSIAPGILVADSAGEVIHGVFGGETGARMDTAMLPGLYRVWVVSGYGEPGEYRLGVREAGQLTTCEPVGAVTIDSTHEGALATTDCVLVDGRYADVWTLQVDSALTTTIDLVSDKFDAYLMVSDTLGASIAEDDDSGSGSNAALTLDLDSGVYHLWATSYAAESLGGYSLTAAIDTAAAAGRVAAPGPAKPEPQRPIPLRSLRPALYDDAPPAWLPWAPAPAGKDGRRPAGLPGTGG